MNRLYIILTFVSLLFFGCSKIDKTKKRLDGTWNAISYKYTNNLGFSYYYETEGAMLFENCSENICSYSINIDYTNASGSGTNNEYGKCFFIDEVGEYFSLYRNEINGIDTLDYGRIILITKSDLKIEYIDSIGRHTFILEN